MNSHPTRDGWFRGSDAECDPMPPPRDYVYRLVLLGPPGVGKGTQAELLCDRLRTCHLSTGDLFRAAKCQADPSPSMAAALDAMQCGELISDELVMSMVQERAKCLHCHGGLLLDGFPRTVKQAEALEGWMEELGEKLDAVFSYELPIDEIVDRIGGRRTCSECKAVYHLSARPPQTEGVCDHCGGALLQRDDDRPEAVRVRMQAYEEATQPLTEFYSRLDRLISIPADGEPEEILRRTLSALDERLGTQTLA